MSLEYVNRKDERYFLYQGTTKTGKPKYFCSRKPTASGVPADAMPDGYEWRESPETGTVTVRRIVVTQIDPTERELVCQAIGELTDLTTFIVDTTERSLVIYVSDREQDETLREAATVRLRHAGMGWLNDWASKYANYSAMMRFVLRDKTERLFTVDRWCTRGSSERWLWLGGPEPLGQLVPMFVRHLGRDSFYDLV